MRSVVSTPIKVPAKEKREQWIRGYSGGTNSKKQVVFPAVTPWIDNQLREKIIKVFMASMDTESSQLRSDIEVLKEEIAVFDALDFLTPPRQRQLAKKKRTLEDLEAKVSGSGDELYQAARKEVMQFNLMRGVSKIDIVTRDSYSTLRFVTCPICIGPVLLGTYDFWINPFKKSPTEVLHLERRDKTWVQGPHPHWSLESRCFGSFGPMFDRIIKRKRWANLAGLFIQYLGIYNGGSPLLRLSDFKQGGIYYNADPRA